jgi:sensor c-di-GMP phosphodiesterase-like protein
MKMFNRLTALIMLGVCITMAIPILTAIMLARHQAMDREESYVAGLAQVALERSEHTADQLGAGARLVNNAPAGEACSRNALDLMRKIDLGSTLLQGVGHVRGDVMDCSSFGGTRSFELGAPELRSQTGTLIRTNVRLVDPHLPYLAVQAGSFVGIVHKELPLSFVDQAPGLNVSVFSWAARKPLITRGVFDRRWLRTGLVANDVYRRDGQLIAVARSNRYDLGAIAALPLTSTAAYAGEAAMILIPLGILAGFGLSAILVHFVQARTSMPGMIRSGLKAGEFHLAYQPVIDLGSGKIVGAEALIRWRRSNGELVPPDTFIPVAEDAGLIPLITARVLDLLSQDARHILRLAPCFHFAVNFSAADMHRTNILEEVRRFVDQSGITVDNLVIEATERSFVDVQLARKTLQQLRAAGIKVAIDDFGTGYSSLGYLAQLEIDYLKIDKLFVQALGTGSATSQVANRIIEMAKDLKLQIIAEGIELNEQAQLLKSLKVDYAQGYLFARPMPVDDLLQRLRADKSAHVIALKAA